MLKFNIERVHRAPTRVNAEKKNYSPRPIVAEVSFFQFKEFIECHIKNLPKGKNLGVADHFPKHVDEIRKMLYVGINVMKKIEAETGTT